MEDGAGFSRFNAETAGRRDGANRCDASEVRGRHGDGDEKGGGRADRYLNEGALLAGKGGRYCTAEFSGHLNPLQVHASIISSAAKNSAYRVLCTLTVYDINFLPTGRTDSTAQVL